MYIRSASSPSTVLWAFHTIQPSSMQINMPVWSCYTVKTAQGRSNDHRPGRELMLQLSTCYFLINSQTLVFLIIITARHYAARYMLWPCVCVSVYLSVASRSTVKTVNISLRKWRWLVPRVSSFRKLKISMTFQWCHPNGSAKHNCPRWDSNLGLLTPQSCMIPLDHCE